MAYGQIKTGSGRTLTLDPQQGWINGQGEQMVPQNYLAGGGMGGTGVNQNALSPDYAQPIDVMGQKGYRVKGDPYKVVTNDGRMISLDQNPELTMQRKKEAMALQAAQLGLDTSSQKLREGELDIKTKQSMLDGSKRPAAPAGFMWNAEGTGVVKIPGFEDGKPATEDQQKSAGYLLRMQHALEVQDQMARDKPDALQPGWGERIASKFSEPLANSLRSPERQRMDAVFTDATDAALTLATGAAYTKEQLEGARKAYAPSIMDDPATAKEKRILFNNMIQSARLRSGGMAPKVDAMLQNQNAQGGSPATSQQSGAPVIGTIKGNYIYRGGDPSKQESWGVLK